MTWLHILAGLIGIASGAVALFALKGAALHRKSGMIFVYSMLFMSSSGAVMAALRHTRISVIAGVLTFYLVTTALLTVRPRAAGFPWIDLGGALVALAVALAGVAFGLAALDSPGHTLDGLPPQPAFMFAFVALLAVLGDVRMMLAGGLQGARRIARHLWRMCFALFIATASFFLGQARHFPKPLRNGALLSLPVLVVLLLMFFWLARVRFTQRYRSA